MRQSINRYKNLLVSNFGPLELFFKSENPVRNRVSTQPLKSSAKRVTIYTRLVCKISPFWLLHRHFILKRIINLVRT